jgi:transcriptional regulator with XRE-family HTH domain
VPGVAVQTSDDNGDVIPSLMDLLATKVRERGVTRAEIRTNFRRDKRTISRYLNKENPPPAGELDQLVTAVAVEVEEDRLALWREAVEDAEERVKRDGHDQRQRIAEAARDTRRRANP